MHRLWPDRFPDGSPPALSKSRPRISLGTGKASKLVVIQPPLREGQVFCIGRWDVNPRYPIPVRGKHLVEEGYSNRIIPTKNLGPVLDHVSS